VLERKLGWHLFPALASQYKVSHFYCCFIRLKSRDGIRLVGVEELPKLVNAMTVDDEGGLAG